MGSRLKHHSKGRKTKGPRQKKRAKQVTRTERLKLSLKNFDREFREILIHVESITHQILSTAKSITLQFALFLLLTYSLCLAVERFLEIEKSPHTPIHGVDYIRQVRRALDGFILNVPRVRFVHELQQQIGNEETILMRRPARQHMLRLR
jgi:hypothetical protein